MAGLSVLVTGATGFIGSHLCRELLERGYHVRAFHRPTSSLRLLDDLQVEHALGDLTQPDTVQAAMEGIEIVFHAAAWMGGHDPTGQQYAVTVEGTRTVLQSARRCGIWRVIHTSSVAALGVPGRSRMQSKTSSHGDPPLIDENHTWNYRPDYYPYAYAKYLAEQEVQKAVAAGLDVVIVNPTYVLGAGDIYRQASSLITQIVDRKIPFATEGGINCVHIADIVDGHLAALNHGKSGERYILGGENLTYLQLLQEIADVVGTPLPNQVIPAWILRLLAMPAHFLRTFLDLPLSPELLRLAGTFFFYDTRKAEIELGLTNHRPVKDAIIEAYEWIRQGIKKPE